MQAEFRLERGDGGSYSWFDCYSGDTGILEVDLTPVEDLIQSLRYKKLLEINLIHFFLPSTLTIVYVLFQN